MGIPLWFYIVNNIGFVTFVILFWWYVKKRFDELEEENEES